MRKRREAIGPLVGAAVLGSLGSAPAAFVVAPVLSYADFMERIWVGGGAFLCLQIPIYLYVLSHSLSMLGGSRSEVIAHLEVKLSNRLLALGLTPLLYQILLLSALYYLCGDELGFYLSIALCLLACYLFVSRWYRLKLYKYFYRAVFRVPRSKRIRNGAS